jgi:dienelactone hydrolase
MTRPAFAIALAAIAIAAATPATAEIRTQTVDYKQGDTLLQGYLAYDDARPGKRPGILVVHTRNGLDAFTKERTEALAKMGYVAFAADIFGKDVRPANVEEAIEQSKKYGADRPLTRLRAAAAFDVLLQQASVDASKIAVIGYCFGGMVALEHARAGAPVLGTAVFHATLKTPTPQDAKNIKGRVLAMHGSEDPIAPQEEVQNFIKEMRDAKVAFELDMYGGVVHGYTNPANAKSPSPQSILYNERADKKSWESMQELFKDIF